MKRFLPLVFFILFAACSEPENESVEAFVIVEATLDADGYVRDETARYSISLRVPAIDNAEARSDVLGFLQEQVDEFLDSAREEPEPDYFESHRYELVSDWKTAESDYLYTYIIRGYSFTGGAHGMPFVRTFTYSEVDDQRIEIDDVLQGNDSLTALAESAAEHFEGRFSSGMADAGLSPEQSNWQRWFASNDRINFIFPVYQIAAYSDGEQAYSVVVDSKTRHLFNPDFFDVLEPDISITDEHGHGPDPGSEEAARSAAWQLIRRSDVYLEGGHSLEITNIERNAEGWLLNYSWQHSGDPDGIYSGQVRVVDDKPEFVE